MGVEDSHRPPKPRSPVCTGDPVLCREPVWQASLLVSTERDHNVLDKSAVMITVNRSAESPN